jgi:hypothetical protein
MFLLYLWGGRWQAAMCWLIAASGNKKKQKDTKGWVKKGKGQKKKIVLALLLIQPGLLD